MCHCVDERDAILNVQQALTMILGQIGDLVPHPKALAHLTAYVTGLLSPVERKNGWQLAEQAGYTHPRGIQRVLSRYNWDADATRDLLRAQVVEQLGDPNGVLVIDETGFPKKGTNSAGVARQYSGTLGKTDNCQIGVFLGYAAPAGAALIDRALFLPKEWLADPDRCASVGIPTTNEHQPKTALAREMVARALAAGVPTTWVVADETYGSDGQLRQQLEAYGQAYVLAVRTNQMTTTWPPYGLPGQIKVVDAITAVAGDHWVRQSCGEGEQGPRVYDWLLLPVRPATRSGYRHAILARRSVSQPDEIAYYLVYARDDATLDEIVRAAGTRWRIEELFERGKDCVGLDQYEVRSWQGWYRHVTLACVALLALVVGTAATIKKGDLAPSTSR
jgi:SRSO17 transposase